MGNLFLQYFPSFFPQQTLSGSDQTNIHMRSNQLNHSLLNLVVAKPLDRYREFDPNCDDQEASNSRENGEYKSGRSPETKNKGTLDDHEEYGDPGSGRSTNGSDLFVLSVSHGSFANEPPASPDFRNT